jgi:hypothetical protein
VSLPSQINRYQGWGLLYHGNNAHTKAQNAYEEALEIRRTLAKTNPDAYLSEMAMALNNLGSLIRVSSG